MDGKGRCLDNSRSFPRTTGGIALDMSHLWRSLKHECVYLHAWESGSQAKTGIGRWNTFCNHQRPHAAHGGQPPAVVCFKTIKTDQQVQALAKITRILSKDRGGAQTPTRPQSSFLVPSDPDQFGEAAGVIPVAFVHPHRERGVRLAGTRRGALRTCTAPSGQGRHDWGRPRGKIRKQAGQSEKGGRWPPFPDHMNAAWFRPSAGERLPVHRVRQGAATPRQAEARRWR